MLKPLQSITAKLVDVVAPARCMGCFRTNTWLCDKCLSRFETTQLTCIGCNQEQPRGRTCPECKHSISLTGVVSVGRYESPLLRRGIYWFKFKGVKDIAEPLAHLMLSRMPVISALKQLQQNAALVPVPLHKRRMLERGFNQSLELCEIISYALKIPVYDIVDRTKQTWTQAKLPETLRNNNVKDAFKIKSGTKISRSKLIIIDDVTTSGSTLDAVARPLWAKGAKEVWGLTIARG